MASTLWLIACVVLDIGVIFTNVCEQLMISIKWNRLNRIDHLLFSLSISDLVCGLGGLGADAWHLWNVTQNVITNHTAPRNITSSVMVSDSASNVKRHLWDVTQNVIKNLTAPGNITSLVTVSDWTSNFTHNGTYASPNQGDQGDQEDPSIIHSIFELVFIFSLFASALHVMYLAAERACAIRFPHVYMLFIRFTFKFAMLSAIWLISLIVTPTLVFTFTGNEATLKLVFGSILAIMMILVLCTNSAVAIFVHNAATNDINMDSRNQQDRKKCLAIMCIFLGLSFFACMLPITLGYFHADHYHDLSNLMVTLNSFINPCIYFVTVYWDAKITKRAFPKMENELMSLDIDDGQALVSKAVDF